MSTLAVGQCPGVPSVLLRAAFVRHWRGARRKEKALNDSRKRKAGRDIDSDG